MIAVAGWTAFHVPVVREVTVTAKWPFVSRRYADEGESSSAAADTAAIPSSPEIGRRDFEDYLT